jgi:hypothetical protein
MAFSFCPLDALSLKKGIIGLIVDVKYREMIGD